MRMHGNEKLVIIPLFVFAVCIIVLLLSWGLITVESISSFMYEFNRLFPNVSSAFLALIGVFHGWFLSNRTRQRMLKASEIRNELEKAYGTPYSMVSKAEERMKVDKGSELRVVVVSREEKKELDRILMRYPHMFPPKIVDLWRTKIRKLDPFQTLVERGKVTDMFFGIPVMFKNEITEEYRQRLEEYYKTTERWKILKRLPKWLRA